MLSTIAFLLFPGLQKGGPREPLTRTSDLAYLRQVAIEVTAASTVKAGESIPGQHPNSTGFSLRVPGATKTYYPAFWIRDAAMMLGDDLVPGGEVEGWIRVVAATQPGSEGLRFPHGLVIPPFSIPDHITLQGQACWFPGAYAEQGKGDYGYLPPADDAFFFVQMVDEAIRLSGKPDFLRQRVKTGWGEQPLSDVAIRAFDSVDVDPKTGLVVCDPTPGKSRVDWGFCDSIVKTGSCLMPSLLRWQAAKRLARLFGRIGDRSKEKMLNGIASQIQKSLIGAFYQPLPNGEGTLLSATGLGRKDDVWASAFAIWLGILPGKIQTAVANHLLALYEQHGVVVSGQVRHLPPSGELGGYWESAKCSPDTYQNGGYWATPTGWLVTALDKVNPDIAGKLLSEFVADTRARRSIGAPNEWINPATDSYANPGYGSSAGLVYISLKQAGFPRR